MTSPVDHSAHLLLEMLLMSSTLDHPLPSATGEDAKWRFDGQALSVSYEMNSGAVCLFYPNDKTPAYDSRAPQSCTEPEVVEDRAFELMSEMRKYLFKQQAQARETVLARHRAATKH